MAALARFVTRRKYWVIAFWVVFAFAMGGVGSGLADKTQDDFASFLPEEAESTEVQTLLKERFPGGETGTGLVLYKREGGALTDADRAKIAADAKAIADKIPVTAPPVVPFAPGAPAQIISPDESAAYAIVAIPQDFDKTAEWGKDTREIVEAGRPDGLETYVTGDLGFFADFEEVFKNLDALLLLATVLLVLILLGAIYRAPLIAVTPIIVVMLSYLAATGFIYLYADAGNNVNSNSTSILVVLMFGVGTDYCLLLVSRYREELHSIEDKHEAMERALRRARGRRCWPAA